MGEEGARLPETGKSERAGATSVLTAPPSVQASFPRICATSHANMSCTRLFFVNRFFYPDHSSTSQILSDLAFHLARRDFQVNVIASRGRYDDPDAALPAFEIEKGVAIHRVCAPRFGRTSLLGRGWDYLAMHRSFTIAVWRLAAPGDRIVVKTDPPMLSVALAPVARRKRLIMINWLQDVYPETALNLGVRGLAPAAPFLVAARNASLRTAARNVAIGEVMARRLESFGLARDQISIIPNWADDEAITPSPTEGNPLRAAWGLEGRFVVGYSGNLGRAHEYDTLLDAADRLRGARDIVFLFVGAGNLTARLKAEVERRGLSASFHFRPYQDREALPRALAVPNAHWISLAPAMEGLIVPSKFYGVAAAGRPTIAVGDPQGEIAQIVARHDCGVAIASSDGAGLAKTILDLRGDPARLEEMGRNARALLEAAFTKRHALQRWEALLRDVATD